MVKCRLLSPVGYSDVSPVGYSVSPVGCSDSKANERNATIRLRGMDTKLRETTPSKVLPPLSVGVCSARIESSPL